MSGRKLQQYQGRLSPAQAVEGINAARRNAQRLAHDAENLLISRRYPSALALAVLAIEEAGKISILRSLALARTEEEARADWREYRRHTAKNRQWLLADYLAQGAKKLADFRGLVEGGGDHPELLDNLKQIALYTDCLGKAHWSVPSDIIEQELSASIVHTAKLLAAGEIVTLREIQLWVRHLGPVWKMGMELMEKGIVDWYAALQEEGIKPSGENEMRTFIVDGLGEP
jgi:AbiV family abortive infection protein